jgi:hypothetical protein
MGRKAEVGQAVKNCALCLHIIESTSFKDSEGNTYNITGIKLMFVTLATYIPIWRTRKW